MQEFMEASAGKDVFDEILDCVSLLVWLRRDPFTPLFCYLHEIKTLHSQGRGILQFVQVHRD